MDDFFDEWDQWDEREASFEADEHYHRGVWITAKKERITLKAMDLNHLVNTIAYIERNDHEYRTSRAYRAMRKELSSRMKAAKGR